MIFCLGIRLGGRKNLFTDLMGYTVFGRGEMVEYDCFDIGLGIIYFIKYVLFFFLEVEM